MEIIATRAARGPATVAVGYRWKARNCGQSSKKCADCHFMPKKVFAHRAPFLFLAGLLFTWPKIIFGSLLEGCFRVCATPQALLHHPATNAFRLLPRLSCSSSNTIVVIFFYPRPNSPHTATFSFGLWSKLVVIRSVDAFLNHCRSFSFFSSTFSHTRTDLPTVSLSKWLITEERISSLNLVDKKSSKKSQQEKKAQPQQQQPHLPMNHRQALPLQVSSNDLLASKVWSIDFIITSSQIAGFCPGGTYKKHFVFHRPATVLSTQTLPLFLSHMQTSLTIFVNRKKNCCSFLSFQRKSFSKWWLPWLCQKLNLVLILFYNHYLLTTRDNCANILPILILTFLFLDRVNKMLWNKRNKIG